MKTEIRKNLIKVKNSLTEENKKLKYNWKNHYLSDKIAIEFNANRDLIETIEKFLKGGINEK